MNATRPLAALTLVAMLAPSATAQTTTGADRYIGSAPSSLGRTNSVIASVAPNYVTPRAGGSAMIGATQKSFDRTTAAMRSMLANRDAAIRGYGQAAIYRTSDNLYGVYWQNSDANRFRMDSNSIASGGAMTPTLAQMWMTDLARRRLQEDARGQEIIRRFNRRTPELPPNRGIFTQDMILNDVPGAVLIRRDTARATRDAPPPFFNPVSAGSNVRLPGN